MTNKNALIIDDEPDIRELLDITLSRMHIDCHCAEDLTTAKALLKKNNFDICLTDMRLPDGDGIDLVAYMQIEYPYIPVAVITAHGNMETAINALKAGAFDFVTKPVDLGMLRNLVKTALKLTNKVDKFETTLIGENAKIKALRNTISKVARSQAPIYISGESGTGKELVAKMIHEQGPRAGKAFVPVNCSAVPHDLMESEFFGHKKGSFTGAVSDKMGLFQFAHGGTLFLDEIAELPMHMQVKLLRAIQEKKVRPVGEQQEVPVDVRILSATHRNLSGQVEQGTFRQDLFYRINVIELHVPPLNKRREDIPLLIEHVLKRIANELGIKPPTLSQSVLDILCNYHFPGNVRELENILERAITLSDGKIIEEQDLQLPEIIPDVGNEGKKTENNNIKLDTYLIDIEKQAILEALEKTRWNKTKAAKLLGISFRVLRYRLQKLGLD